DGAAFDGNGWPTLFAALHQIPGFNPAIVDPFRPKVDHGVIVPASDAPATLIGQGSELHHTDLGNARRLMLYFGDELRHCPPRRKWLTWDGQRWRWDEAGKIKQFAKRTVNQIWHEVNIAVDRGAHAKHAKQSEGKQRVDAMI